MPLMTEIVRDGEPLKLRWGWWHVEMMLEATQVPGRSVFNWGPEVRVMDHEWAVCDPSDGEVLHLRPGDELMMWRGTLEMSKSGFLIIWRHHAHLPKWLVGWLDERIWPCPECDDMRCPNRQLGSCPRIAA